jgi:tRNA threonylcarbamoyl adenosine modification protein (Sua5/YciO/YrdC/YwlC family)
VDNIRKASDDATIDECVDVLGRGGVIAVPTDTIYGLASSAVSQSAIDKIYHIKMRTTARPLAVCVGNVEDINKWAHSTVSDDLLSKLLPGPVTIILKKRETLSTNLHSADETLGFRIPDSSFIMRLARKFDYPIALTSANISNQQSTLCIEEFESLWSKLDLVIDGGKIERTSREGSTVVQLSKEGYYSIVRRGCAYEDTVSVLQRYGLVEL